MISDVLSDAISDVRRYFADPAFRGVYEGREREEIEALLVHMENVLLRLDTPPKPAPAMGRQVFYSDGTPSREVSDD